MSPWRSAIWRVRRTRRRRIAGRAGFPGLPPKRPARRRRIPNKAAARTFPARPVALAMHGEKTGNAFDHHVAHIGGGFADERDAADGTQAELRTAKRETLHPFGAGARLARAASAEDEPDPPGQTVGREIGRPLIPAGDEFPVIEKPRELARGKIVERVIQAPFRRAIAQAVEQAPRGVRPVRGAARCWRRFRHRRAWRPPAGRRRRAAAV